MKDIFSENIRNKVITDFASSENQQIFDEFNNSAKYFVESETEEFLEDNETIENIFLGIIKLSEGNISKFNEAINEAKRDWRNVLYWSE